MNYYLSMGGNTDFRCAKTTLLLSLSALDSHFSTQRKSRFKLISNSYKSEGGNRSHD